VLFYERHVGKIPNGYEVHHICEKPACVNPQHLTVVTRKQHMDTDGREPYGNSRAGSKVKRITFNGETLTLPEWSKRLGLHSDTVYRRIYAYGWPEELAVSTPFVRYRRAGKPANVIEAAQ
jgi:hypothetical protein